MKQKIIQQTKNNTPDEPFSERYWLAYARISIIGIIFLTLSLIIVFVGYLLSTLGVNITQQTIDLFEHYLVQSTIGFFIFDCVLALVGCIFRLVDVFFREKPY